MSLISRRCRWFFFFCEHFGYFIGECLHDHIGDGIAELTTKERKEYAVALEFPLAIALSGLGCFRRRVLRKESTLPRLLPITPPFLTLAHRQLIMIGELSGAPRTQLLIVIIRPRYLAASPFLVLNNNLENGELKPTERYLLSGFLTWKTLDVLAVFESGDFTTFLDLLGNYRPHGILQGVGCCWLLHRCPQ